MKRVTISSYVFPGIGINDREEWLIYKSKLTKVIIVEKVAEIYNISFEQVLFGKKHIPDAEARSICSYILNVKLGVNKQEIGRFFQIHRTSVLMEVKKIQKRLNTCKIMREKFLKLERGLFE